MSQKDSMKKKIPLAKVAGAVAPRRAPTVITKEFKLAAVARMRAGPQNPTTLALELGIRRNQLYKWATIFDTRDAADTFNGPGRLPVTQESELVRVRRALKKAEEELAILKKFDAYLTRRKL
jgi:transposase